MIIICNTCGKEFNRNKSQIKSKKVYCNRKCKDKAHSESMMGKDNHGYKEREKLKCANCEEMFIRKYLIYKKPKNCFCSKPCEYEWRANNSVGEKAPCWKGGLPNCESCGKGLSVRGYTLCGSCNQIGELNSRWKGGRGYLFNNLRRLKKYKEWRTNCFIRDEYTCQHCGDNCCELNVHHMNTVKNIIVSNNLTSILEAKQCKELWDITNGTTLCTKCHKEEHYKKVESTKNTI